MARTEKLDPERVNKFREVLRETRDYLVSPEKWPPEEELELFDKIIDAWYEPVVFHYNLLGPNNEPTYITSQYEWAQKQPKGVIHLLIGLPGVYFTLYKDKLYMNRLMYQEGRYGEVPPENFQDGQ